MLSRHALASRTHVLTQHNGTKWSSCIENGAVRRIRNSDWTSVTTAVVDLVLKLTPGGRTIAHCRRLRKMIDVDVGDLSALDTYRSRGRGRMMPLYSAKWFVHPM